MSKPGIAQSASSSEAPLLSVIVACKNAAATIRKCLDSLVAQKESLAEIVVMDGGSTDGTLRILDEFRRRIAHFESKKDGGISHAWNKALAHVRGDWIYFLGADDFIWSPDVFERIAPSLRSADPTVTIVYGNVTVLTEGGQPVAVGGRPWEEARQAFLQGANLYHQGVFHRRCIFNDRGFDLTYAIVMDFEVLIDPILRSAPLYVPDVIIAGYRAGGNSNRPRRVIEAVHETGRALKEHGHPRSIRSAAARYVRALGWAALLSGGSVIPERVWRRLSRVLISFAASLRRTGPKP